MANEKESRSSLKYGSAKRSVVEAQEEKNNKKFRRNTILVVAAIVVLLVASLLINSSIFYTRTNAVTIGDTKYSPAEVSYFFKTTANQVYNRLYQQLGSLASYYMDLNTPLSEQMYSDTQTWADVVLENTLDNMQSVTVYNDAAKKEGRALSEAGRANVDSDVAEMSAAATTNGYSSLDKFLAAYFCKGMTEDLYTELLEKSYLAAEYSEALSASMTYTAEDLSAYYDAHAEEFDAYDYYVYSIGTASAKFEDLDDEAKKEAAHEAAEKIASAASVDEFLALVNEFNGSETTVSMTRNAFDSVVSTYEEWLSDASRKAGDTTVIDTDTNSSALYYVGIDNNDYNVVDMRHILVNAIADENGEYTDEALENAKARAEELLAEWQADPTEEHFSDMANMYSDDGGSNTNGGLYTAIAKNDMVAEINDFLFADGRQVGDTAVVYGSNGSYAGYHVVYYAAVGENLRDLLADNYMRSDDTEAAYEAMKGSNYEVSTGSGMKYANIA